MIPCWDGIEKRVITRLPPIARFPRNAAAERHLSRPDGGPEQRAESHQPIVSITPILRAFDREFIRGLMRRNTLKRVHGRYD